MQRVGYIFFRLLIVIFWFIPFWLLYLISDFTYFLLYYVTGYRKKVVYSNLKNSFPEKTELEIKKLAKQFYHNLSDITVESVKGMSMSKKSILKRYKVLNLELEQKYFDEGKNIIGMGSHYANWEWGVISFGYQLKHKCFALYKPLSNKYIDKYIRKTRAISGIDLVSIKDTRTTFHEKSDIPELYIMVSDQSPSNMSKAHRFDFLNQDTAWLHGADFYARKYNFPVLYGDVQRVKRGYYEVTLLEVETQPEITEETEITGKFAEILEQIIRKKPEDWLWSHKRWKEKRVQA